VILQDANVMDTITKTMADGISTWPASVSALGIYFMQSLLNLIIPSGSGQAAVSLPILAPVGELIGITRQTSVLAYQLGDGLTNIFTPTQGYLMAALAILKIPWTVWARWLLPLLAIWFLLGAVAVLVARVVHFGPF
ncbi:MAG: AbgT family transporter, partial [Lysobacterales bacterium]